MPTHKLLFFLAVWMRPEITEICFMGIRRIQKVPGFDIKAFAVISEESMIPLCEKYGVEWCMYKNNPLGEKKNYGISQIRNKDFDFLIEIGSDDLILDELLIQYQKFFVKYDFFGICDAAYINSEDLHCRRLQSNSTYGAGRAISKRALEKVNYNLWPEKLERGMDNRSIIRLYKEQIKYWVIPAIEFPCVIDIKSQVNIWPFNYLLGVEYDINEIFSRISPEEVNAIKCLKQVYKSASLIER